MKHAAKKAIQTGYGIGLLSLGQAKKVAAKVKKDLNLDEKECIKLAKELVATSEKTSKDVLGIVSSNLEKAVLKLGLASKNELKMAKNRLKSRFKCSLKPSKEESAFCRLKRKVWK